MKRRKLYYKEHFKLKKESREAHQGAMKTMRHKVKQVLKTEDFDRLGTMTVHEAGWDGADCCWVSVLEKA